jgi:uncharacterized protein YbbC (DUF1343 family)
MLLRHFEPITSLLTAALSLAACQPGPRPNEPPAQPPAGSATASAEAPPDSAPAEARVLPGLEVLLRDSMALIRGKRLGLITNQTAVTSTGEHAADGLARAPGANLVALFGPEHGIRGTAEGGATVESGRDQRTGLPVFSLYGKTQRPTAEMLQGVEMLLFDIQDIGARPYTFVWTMAMALEEAAKRHIPFVVLDRPNPITARMAGPLMEMEMRNVGQPITGYYPVPLRHGMTVGEIARYLNGEYDLGAELHVIPAEGWRPMEWYDETGLPWVNPSPNIRSLEAALNYAGMVLFEATNLTVGRGTDRPFSYVGAPWLDGGRLLAATRQYELPGVRLDTVTIVPRGEGYVPYRGERVHAVELTITDRDAYRPVWTALVLLSEIKRLQPDRFRVTDEGFTQMLGSRWARQAFDRGEDPREIWTRWEAELQRWSSVRDRYRLYR